MSRTNCPNCGAPVRGAECEYCGTYFGVKTSYVKPKAYKPSPSASLLEAIRKSSFTLDEMSDILGGQTWRITMSPRDEHTGFVDHRSHSGDHL